MLVTGLVECPDARWILLGYGWYIICIYTMSIYALECSYAMLLYGIPHVTADMFKSSSMISAYDTYNMKSSYVIMYHHISPYIIIYHQRFKDHHISFISSYIIIYHHICVYNIHMYIIYIYIHTHQRDQTYTYNLSVNDKFPSLSQTLFFRRIVG